MLYILEAIFWLCPRRLGVRRVKLSRRDFLLGTVSALALHVADARVLRGSPTASVIGGSSVVVNAGQGQFAFLNIAKNFAPTSTQAAWPGTLDANQYPGTGFTGNLTNSQTNVAESTYYGHYLVYWSGSSGFQFTGLPAIVYSGGAYVFGITPSTSGSVPNNFGMSTSNGSPTAGPGVSNPVEFAFGFLLTAVGTNGGLLQFTTQNSNDLVNTATGAQVSLNNLTYSGGAFPFGPNSDGSWTITSDGANHLTLQGSGALSAANVSLAAGGAGTQTEAVLSVASVSWQVFSTTTGWTNLVWCKKADNAAILAGQYVSPTFVNTFKGLKPAFIRVMDMSSVQNIAGAQYAQRVTPSTMSWAGNNPLPYWGGTLSNTSDAFTCSNPTASPASGAYIDGEVVCAQVGASAANTTQKPTLNVGGRGAAPIYTSAISQLNCTFGGPVPPTGTVISFVFSANGGLTSPFTYHYTTSTSVSGPGGVLDNSFANIAINIRADINANTRGNSGALITAGLTCFNPTIAGSLMAFVYNPNVNSSGAPSLGAGMTITGSDNASSGTYTFGFVPVSYMANSAYCALTYNALIQGWVTTVGNTNGGGVRSGPPIEFYTDLCAKVGAGMWLNVGIIDQPTTIYSTVLQIAQASPAVNLNIEFGNETWNYGESSALPCQTLGAALGLVAGSGQDLHGFVGLRVIQMAQQAVQAWSDAGRSRSQLKVLNAYQFVDMNTAGTTPTCLYRMLGQVLNASGTGTNAFLKAFGGPANGTSTPTAITTNYSVAPNRPVDWSDDISPAPYWMGGQLNAYGPQGHLNTSGLTATDYSPLLTASNNYVNGTTLQKAAALDFLYSTSTLTGTMYDAASFASDAYSLKLFALGSSDPAAGYWGVGTFVASLDSSRAGTGTSGGAQAKCGVICYEGGDANGPVANAGDLPNLIADLTTLGDNSTSFGGTGNPTTDATNIAILYEAFRNDARYGALVTRYLTEARAAFRSGGTRDAMPAWFGFEGPGDFSLYPGSLLTTPYQSYGAIGAFV